MPRRYSAHITAVLLVAVGVLLYPGTAHADPHAIFYTATGQRQLFFNVLAALDQADYVEPEFGEFGRNELLEKRDAQIEAELTRPPGATPAPGAKDPIIEATKTDLSGLLTRAITLEGTDLWTEYVFRQNALDVVRTAASQDFIDNVLCKTSLGRPECSDKPEEVKKREIAYVTDPAKFESHPFSYGWVAALLTGTDEHTDEARRLKRDGGTKEFVPGFAANPSILALQDRINGRGRSDGSTARGPTAAAAAGTSSQGVKDAVERGITRAAWSAFPLAVSEDLYDGVTIDDEGSVGIELDPDDPEYLAWYDSKVKQHLFRARAFEEAAGAGAKSIDDANDILSDEGAVARLKLKNKKSGDDEGDTAGSTARGFCSGDFCTAPLPTPGDTGGDDDDSPIRGGGLYANVELPVNIGIAAGRTSVEGLSSLNTTREGVLLENRLQPAGDTKLLNPRAGHGVIAGATTEEEEPEGRVLHSTTSNDEPATVRDDFGPGAPLGVAREFAYLETRFARALGNEHIAGASGCGCSASGAMNGFGTEVINKINGL